MSPNLHERLLLLRMISHDALIVCQTNEQVKHHVAVVIPSAAKRSRGTPWQDRKLLQRD